MRSGPAAAADAGLALLERRRRLALRGALAALAIGVLGWPLGLAIGEEGPETREAIGGAFLFAALAGLRSRRR